MASTPPHLEKNNPIYLRVVAVLVLLAIIVLFAYMFSGGEDMLGNVHKHADFKVFLNGQSINFSQEKYMSNENHSLSPFFHLHDMNGEVLHQHIKGMTLGDFFDSLGMSFNATCFILDSGESFCNDDAHRLKMFVDGDQYYRYDTYEFRDLDRILIIYGNETEEQIEVKMALVGNDACIYSESCPERGSPPSESNCVGTGGCDA